MPKELSTVPTPRRKDVVVTVRPYYSPNPDGHNYEQPKVNARLLHITFRHMSDLLGEIESYAAAYRHMFQSANLPPSLEEDVHRLEQFES